ncbi:Alpha/Beta hydrolase protein [Podospora didyma]|uniref:Alpha/Beta hydrolase protein n=1 Tax=Podospora didyma TaxID=330526 RepID=A0AAE0U3J2_9PEZI|nr:Alpha/Beta hydrolase protein [Podospora didyma]
MKAATILRQPSLLLATCTVLHTAYATSSTAKTCTSYNIAVTVSTTNAIFGLPHFQTDLDVADFVNTLGSRDSETAMSVTSPMTENVTASYTIAATFCRPDGRGAGKNSTVLIATHGLGFDKSYWDPQLDKTKYSFVDFVVSQGFSILTYDRLGVGASSQVSGYVAQLSNQVAILTELTHLVKAGKYVGDTGKPAAVVLVGHSFGSATSITAVSNDVTLADGLILTGFSLNVTNIDGLGFTETLGLRIASKQQPGKWRQLDTGYVTNVDLVSNVGAFFKAPDYDPAVARFAEANKAPFGTMELITGQRPGLPYAFQGVAMIISGKFDLIFCKSDCDDVLETPGARVFGHANAFKAISYPGAGHGINFHLNATGAFQDITDFLSASGL